MLNVEANLFSEYQASVSSSIDAFLPLMGAVIGVFLAFAIANMLRHFILKMK